jgi:hypothetical protein
MVAQAIMLFIYVDSGQQSQPGQVLDKLRMTIGRANIPPVLDSNSVKKKIDPSLSYKVRKNGRSGKEKRSAICSRADHFTPSRGGYFYQFSPFLGVEESFARTGFKRDFHCPSRTGRCSIDELEKSNERRVGCLTDKY